MVKCMVGFSFHLFRLELIILVDSFSDILKPSSFRSFVQNYSHALSFHLFGEQFILLFFKLVMKLFFTSLFFLLFKNVFSLIFIHSFPVVGLYSVSAQFRLTCFLVLLHKLQYSKCKNRFQSRTQYDLIFPLHRVFVAKIID